MADLQPEYVRVHCRGKLAMPPAARDAARRSSSVQAAP